MLSNIQKIELSSIIACFCSGMLLCFFLVYWCIDYFKWTLFLPLGWTGFQKGVYVMILCFVASMFYALSVYGAEAVYHRWERKITTKKV